LTPSAKLLTNTTIPIEGSVSGAGRGGRAEQMKILGRVITEGVKEGMTDRVIIEALETVLVESEAYNNPGGDADSAGIFQQQGKWWGPYAERTNPEVAARKFYAQARNVDAQHPNWGTGAVAQGVQISAWPEKYQPREADAQAFLKLYRGE
jgi:hypothetical protein